MPDGLGHRCARHDPLLDRRRRPRRHGLRVFGPGRLGSQLLPDPHPDICSRGAGALPQRTRHPREQLLVRVRLPDPLGELGEHLVRRGALAVDEPVGEALRPSPERLEREGDDRRGRGRQHRAGPAPDERAHADDDRHVHERDEDREGSEQHGSVDHEVDVEQPVPQHRHTDRERDQRERHDHEVLHPREPARVALPAPGAAERREHRPGIEQRHERGGREQPPQLEALDAGRSAEPEDERGQ